MTSENSANDEMEIVDVVSHDTDETNTLSHIHEVSEEGVENGENSKEDFSESDVPDQYQELGETAGEASNQTDTTSSEMIPSNTNEASATANKTESKTKHATRLPLARIKNIMKMDPDVQLVSQDSVFLITKATEMFIEFLAKEAGKQMASAKRRTLLRKDVDNMIDSIPHLCFLDGIFE